MKGAPTPLNGAAHSLQRGELGVDLGEESQESAHRHPRAVPVQQRLDHAHDPARAPPRPIVEIEEAICPR